MRGLALRTEITLGAALSHAAMTQPSTYSCSVRTMHTLLASARLRAVLQVARTALQ